MSLTGAGNTETRLGRGGRTEREQEELENGPENRNMALHKRVVTYD